MFKDKRYKNKNCNTVKEIKEEIKQKNYNIEFSQDLKDRVKNAIIRKRLICGK